MAFNVNHDEAAEYELLPEGEYEVIIKSCKQTTSKNGTPCVNMQLVVRNDVAQSCQNYVLWDNLWKRREPTSADMAVEGYSVKQVQSLSKAAGLPNGKSYADINEWAADLAGKLIRVTIEHEEYQGSKYARVKWRNESKQPTCKHIWKKEEANVPDVGYAELDEDEDVPF